MVFNYSKAERYRKILEVIKSDDYYLETKGEYEQIAYYTNECIEIFYQYTIDNPIVDKFGGKIYFGYDPRTFDREILLAPQQGILIAQIKSAAHLITQDDGKSQKRFLDISKSQNLSLLKETLFYPDYRLKILNPKNELTFNYIYEKNKKYYIAVSKIEADNLGRIITFLPQNSRGSILKKIASAIETKAKTSTEQTPLI